MFYVIYPDFWYSLEIFDNFGIHYQGGGGLISVAAPLWFLKFQEKMENFGFLLKISRFWTIMSFNFPKWRWEGYIIIKSCFFLSVLVTGVVYPIATHWSWTGLGWLAQEWALNTDDWFLNGDHWLPGSDDFSGDSLTLPALPLFIWRARFSLCLAVLSSEQGDTYVRDLFWIYKSF